MRKLMACLVALAFTSVANAAIIYVADDRGNVGRYDTVSNIGSAVGNLNSFGISQNLGLAYNPANQAILLMDRNTNRVFSMNSTTGAAALLFNSTGSFQGGAVSGGLLYGTQENSQTVVAYSLTSPFNQTVTGGVTPSHTHSTGVNPATGQLYLIGADGVVRLVNADGTLGAPVVTATGLGEFVDDLDYFGGNFLVTQFSADTLFLVNGTTGASSLFLTSAQLNAMGLSGNITGVTVAAEAAAVPEPVSMIAFGGLLVGGVGVALRRRMTKKVA